MRDRRCVECNDNPGRYGDPENVMDRDAGTDIFVLVRVSPIDLFGLTLIFFISELDVQPMPKSGPMSGLGRRPTDLNPNSA